MPRGSGLRGSGLSLRSIRSDLKSSPTYEDFVSSRKQEIKDQSTLKYGGGFGRKVLYGMTKSVTGEKIADKLAQTFRDKDKTEQAYQNLKGEDKQETKVTSKIEKLSSTVEDTKTSIDDLENTATEILKIVGDISKKLAPKDITVGKGEAAQTFRYDPLAPEGKKVTVVTGSGKAGRFASKKEASSVLSKAAYLGNLSQQPMQQPMAEKLPRSKETVLAALQDAAVPIQKVQTAPRRSQISRPETYDEYLGVRKRLSKAEQTLRYGGKGLGRKLLFGATKSILGEKASLKIATLGRNKEQTEQAYQTIVSGGVEQKPTTSVAPQEGPSETQVTAKAGVESRTMSETTEAETEWKDDVIKRLERIERKLEEITGSGGLFGSLLNMLGGLLAGGGGILGGLGKIFGRNKPGSPGKPGGPPKPSGPSTGAPRGPGKFKIPTSAKAIGAGAIIGIGGEMAADYFGRDTTAGAVSDVVGTTASYASTGAMIGSIIPGVGTAIGGAIGGVVGLGSSLYSNRDVLFGPDEEDVPPLRGAEIPVDAKPNLNKETDPEVQALEDQFKPLTQEQQDERLGIQPAPKKAQTNPNSTIKVENLETEELKEVDNIETRRLQVEDLTVRKMQESSKQYEDTVEQNITETQTQQAPPPVIINNQTPPPAVPPQPSGGGGTIQIRNTEPSVATYNASIFDHPVTHPGIYKM